MKRVFVAAAAAVIVLFSCKGNINNNDITLSITSRVSIDSGGIQGNGPSDAPSISADGRVVAFRSGANNLVADDPGSFNDIFLRDTHTGQTWKMTVTGDSTIGIAASSPPATLSPTPTGSPGPIGPIHADNHSFDPAISGQGRHVAFATFATNLSSPPDESTYSDIYVTDLAKLMVRISFPHNLGGPTVNGNSSRPTLSYDGTHIAFQSDANNLVPGDAGFTDIFHHNLGNLKLMSKGPGPASDGNSTGPLLSSDGNYIVFQSLATNLTADFDGNGTTDIFRVNTVSGAVDLVSVDVTGTQSANGVSSDPAISSDGRFIVFASVASDLVGPGIDNNAAADIYIRDMVLGLTARVSASIAGSDPDGACLKPSMSGDGQFVAFESPATNLIGLDTNNASDVFIRNLATGEMQRASVKTFGGEAAGTSFSARLSTNGRFIAMGSLATNLVEKDTNALADVFLRGPLK